MDGESNYESDISESWSLIDINLNEELNFSTEASTPLSNTPSSESKISGNLEKRDDVELESFLNKCKKSNGTDFREVSDSDSDSSFKNDEVATCSKCGFNARKCPCDAGKNDSGDTESIEILDLDGHQDSEKDRLGISPKVQQNFPTYQSDDEDSLEEGVSRTNVPAVIKRKRQRLNRNSENSVYSVNSPSKPNKSNLKTCSSYQKEESHETDESHSPVYKHYRNNVANTFLNLSVGVIFAGVACIAIGHFLGVQNAAETAVELAETLKKLQMENAALQSRLFHLNRALVTQEMNSKELPASQPQPKKVACEQPAQNPSKTSEPDLNSAALSEIRSSLKSFEWLAKMKNTLQTNHREEIATENGLNLSEFGKYIHDQLHFLKKRQEEGAKLFEDTDKKISKVLKKIIHRLLSSHDNIEILYQKLMKLKNKLNHKPKEILSDFEEESQSATLKQENRFTLTERDLQALQWNPENKVCENRDLFIFPQPEKYYALKSNRTLESKKLEKRKSKRKKDKKHEKKDKQKRVKKKETKKRNQGEFYKTKIQNKKYQELKNKDLKFNRRLKKHKKLKKILLSTHQKDLNKKPSRPYSEPQCFNLTGYWMFKWSDGRKEFRRHHTLSDWQFERAKARKELRDDDFKENWQFKRAFARESNRNHDRVRREKQTNYNGKEFFHERFSWF